MNVMLFHRTNLKSFVFSLFLFFFGWSQSYALTHATAEMVSDTIPQQSILIQGKVIDKESKMSIPYCSITIDGTYKGSSTNEDGEFIITLDSLPGKLVFSHLSFKPQKIELRDNQPVLVELEPYVNSLETVTLEARKSERYAVSLARRALERTKRMFGQKKYGKALYRQKSKNGEVYTELSEIMFDIRYDRAGINDWEIEEGRYALKDRGVMNKNFTLLSKILKSLQPDTEDIYFPLHDELEQRYDIYTLEKIQTDQGELAVLRFKPKDAVSTPIFAGELTIDTKTFDVLKVVGKIARDDVDLIAFTQRKSAKKNYSINYEMVFKRDSVLDVVMDNIKVNQEFDYYLDDVLQTHVYTTSNLFFYEYYTPEKRKRLGRSYRGQSDWQKLNLVGYNKKFWEENPIVKRTPVESEVIASFEAENSFESIYLNSREQIAMSQSTISDDPFIVELTETMSEYNATNPVEKIYLQTNKETYVAGEQLGYSAFAVLGPNHYPSWTSETFHVDLIGPDQTILIAQQRPMKLGRGSGTILLDTNLKPGTYQLRAYTNWMRNEDAAFFFNKTVTINKTSSYNTNTTPDETGIDLQFLPEGGSAVAGLNNRIAFKAVGTDGQGVDIEGSIVDANGNHVSFIRSFDQGAGYFDFKPMHGQMYKALLKNNSKTYPLPIIESNGYVMAVNNSSIRSIKIKVEASENLKSQPFYVVGSLRNVKLYQGKFEFHEKPIVEFEIPKTKLPSGVMTLTLFDQNKTPLCERVVFVNNQEGIVIRTKTKTEALKPREKVTVEFLVTDTEGRPVSADLSVAVTDADSQMKSMHKSNIITNLLLESDIKGHIESPGQYFAETKRALISRLDLIMLTNGWRKINWNEMKEDIAEIKPYQFKKGFSISGVATTMSDKPLQGAVLNLLARSADRVDVYTALTNDFGGFVVDNIQHTEAVNLLFKGYKNSDTPLQLKITLDKQPDVSPLLPLVIKTKRRIAPIKEIVSDALHETYDMTYGTDEVTQLEPVEIVGINETVTTPKPVLGSIPADQTVVIDDESGVELMEQISRLSGVEIIGSGLLAKVSIRGSGSPLWVVDGFPVYETVTKISDPGAAVALSPTMSGPTYIPPIIASMSPAMIDRVEVLRGGHAAMFGARANNGVIMVYTKKGGAVDRPDQTVEFNLSGYAVERKFYSPKYEVRSEAHKKPDNRSTLYWNPFVKTDNKGKASLTFYNSDIGKQLQIEVEGLSNYGLTGYDLSTIGKAARN